MQNRVSARSIHLEATYLNDLLYMAMKSKLNFEEHTLEAKDKQNCEVNPNLQQEEEKLKST